MLITLEKMIAVNKKNETQNPSTRNTKLFKTILTNTLYLIPLFSLCACGDDEVPTPHPRGYYRIALPEKHYLSYNEQCPYTFEYPDYSNIEHDTNQFAEPCWININYGRFKAKLHLSYKVVNGNLRDYLEQSRQLAIQHQVKASAMKESPVMNDSAKVYGLIYEFGGNTASSLQFYVTDSTRHFMRGALYFFALPNADSVAPVYEFLKKDIYHMIETFRWRNEIVVKETKKKEMPTLQNKSQDQGEEKKK